MSVPVDEDACVYLRTSPPCALFALLSSIAIEVTPSWFGFGFDGDEADADDAIVFARRGTRWWFDATRAGRKAAESARGRNVSAVRDMHK
jgi:hypothetical protein|tara:strand:+ start:205 stop:474 length:270 start_codon:yes stop_codon:yes gene_type:complete